MTQRDAVFAALRSLATADFNEARRILRSSFSSVIAESAPTLEEYIAGMETVQENIGWSEEPRLNYLGALLWSVSAAFESPDSGLMRNIDSIIRYALGDASNRSDSIDIEALAEVSLVGRDCPYLGEDCAELRRFGACVLAAKHYVDVGNAPAAMRWLGRIPMVDLSPGMAQTVDWMKRRIAGLGQTTEN